MSRRKFMGITALAMGLTTFLPPVSVQLLAAPLRKVKDEGVLRVAVYKDNAPWSSSVNGKIVGIDADIANAIASALDVNLDLAELVADESVDDDLRNGVWKGGLLGFRAADIMMHVPFDRQFAARNDQVAIVSPYARERFVLAGKKGVVDIEAPVTAFRGHKIAVEIDTIPDFYLLGASGGILANDIVHYMSGALAADALLSGEAELALTSTAQIEAALAQADADKFVIRKGNLPGFFSLGWDLGIAVKDNSRTLGDAAEAVINDLIANGRMKAIFGDYGVRYQAASVA